MTPKKMNQLLKISLGAVTVLIIAAIYFANNKLTEVATNTSKLKAEIEITNQKLKNYEVTKSKIEELSYVKDIAAKVLPQNEDQSAVVAELADFAKRSNISTGSISFVDSTLTNKLPSAKTKAKAINPTPQGVSIIPVKFEVSGDAKYEDVLSFLKYIENNRRKMQVTEIALTPSGDNGDVLNNVSISLNLFAKKSTVGAKQ
jgi:hypothetical protein